MFHEQRAMGRNGDGATGRMGEYGGERSNGVVEHWSIGVRRSAAPILQYSTTPLLRSLLLLSLKIDESL